MIPVKGLDAGAWENWTSLCQQNYPTYEILFGVMNTNDLCVPTLEKLAATYPEKVRLLVGLTPKGFNHKDSILSYLLEKAQYEYIVFADSDIRVDSNYLATIVAPLEKTTVGLVTCAFVGFYPQSLGAALASLGRCADFIPSALLARVLDGKIRFAVGATLVTRQSSLERAGGLQFNRIGSDYNLGKRFVESGYEIVLSRYLLDADTGKESVREVWARELRWARTIRFNRGKQYYGMVFCYGLVYCLLLLLVTGFAAWAVVLTVVTLLIRYAQALIAIQQLGCWRLLGWLWCLPLRDGLSFLIWFLGAFGQKVFWRGRWLEITGDGLIRE
jgi:ceramide glucosyltransferase